MNETLKNDYEQALLNVEKIRASITRDYGGHAIAAPYFVIKRPSEKSGSNLPSPRTIAFDAAYKEVFPEYRRCRKLSDNEEFRAKIKEALSWRFEDIIMDDDEESDFDIEDFITERTDRKSLNEFKKLRRVLRKARMYKWTDFYTQTYDDKKFATEEDFQNYISKMLSNLSTRRGWCYMGVWERGEKNQRLHFHALLYIPEGQMIGRLEQSKECYDFKTGKRKSGLHNTYLADKCGRNEFDPIPEYGNHLKDIINYIRKYLCKSGERMRYGRGCPEEVKMIITKDDVCAELSNQYSPRFVLHDTFTLKLMTIRQKLKIKGEFADLFGVAA